MDIYIHINPWEWRKNRFTHLIDFVHCQSCIVSQLSLYDIYFKSPLTPFVLPYDPYPDTVKHVCNDHLYTKILLTVIYSLMCFDED